MYSVFVIKLVKETKGLRIVKLHKDDRDAQAIYEELCEYYTGEASQMAISNLNEMKNSVIDAKLPKVRRINLSLSMQRWIALVEEFNGIALIERQVNDAQQLVYLKRFIRDVPEVKEINKMVDVMCSGRTTTPAEKIQIYFDLTSPQDGIVKLMRITKVGEDHPLETFT